MGIDVRTAIKVVSNNGKYVSDTQWHHLQNLKILAITTDDMGRKSIGKFLSILDLIGNDTPSASLA